MKKLILRLLLATLAVPTLVAPVAKPAPKSPTQETARIINIFVIAAQEAGYSNLPPELQEIYAQINPSKKPLSQVEITTVIDLMAPEYQQEVIRVGRETTFNAMLNGSLDLTYPCIHSFFETLFGQVHKTLMTEQRPLGTYANLTKTLLADQNGTVVLPEVEKVCTFLELIEQCFDKRDNKPLYYYFTRWMQLMKNKQGEVLPGLENVYKFFEDNRKCRAVFTLRSNFDKAFRKEIANPFEFLESIIVSLLETDPKAPLVYYVDLALPLMCESNGQVKPELREVYEFVKENRNTTKLLAFLRKLDKFRNRLQGEAQFAGESEKYQASFLELKEHFERKYPIEELPRTVFSHRIGCNIKFLQKHKI